MVYGLLFEMYHQLNYRYLALYQIMEGVFRINETEETRHRTVCFKRSQAVAFLV